MDTIDFHAQLAHKYDAIVRQAQSSLAIYWALRGLIGTCPGVERPDSVPRIVPPTKDCLLLVTEVDSAVTEFWEPIPAMAVHSSTSRFSCA